MVYDREQDCYHCGQGHRLTAERVLYRKKTEVDILQRKQSINAKNAAVAL